MNYCSIHNHTEYSNTKLRDCIIKIKDLVKRAIGYGYKGVAITDHEVLSAHVQALQIRDSIEKEHPDFKIILGNEIYLIADSEYKNALKYYHFILLAKDRAGHDQLRELSSRAWERSYTDRGMLRTPTFYQDFQEIVGNNKGHLIASTACLGGRLASSIIKKDSDAINQFIPWMVDTFGSENCFLEMQDSDGAEQIIVNNAIVRLSDFFNLSYIITSDTHYLDKEDIGIHHAFLNSKEEKERETEQFYKYSYIKTEEDIREILKYLPSDVVTRGLENTLKIYDMVENFDIRHDTIVPFRTPSKFEVAHLLQKWYDKYDSIKKFAQSEHEQDRYLLHLIENGLADKKIDITEEIAERINIELDVIWYISDRLNQRLSAYLNLVKNIIDIIWQVSFVGVARGSAACFLINYLLDIVQMNPMQYNIPYWRFANKERIDMMDIDIDVNPEKVPQIIALLRQYYGDDNVLNCLTFKTESLKSAILTSCRGININNDDAQLLSAMVPVERGKVMGFRECVFGDEEKGSSPVAGFQDALRKYDGLYETVEKVEGLISGRGIHASALYIFNDGYLKQNSLMRAPNKTLITSYNMQGSDSLGALKFDLLSTELQTKFMKCFELLLADNIIEWQGSLRATYNKYLHPDRLIYNDPIMWKKAAEGKVMNLFQFEGVQGEICIRKTKPTSVLQMGAANAVMRLQSDTGISPIDRYVSFKNNINLWYQEMNDNGVLESEYSILEPHLLQKFGCSIEQEDFMVLVMDPKIANFSLKDSNGLRKAISKKLPKMIQEYKDKFFEQGVKIGSRNVFLHYVWDYCIQSLAGYAFSIPHDIAYSIEAVQQMNLSTTFNHLYWSCACLSVNAGSSITDFNEYADFGDEEDGIEEDVEDEVVIAETGGKVKITNTNYGKVAKAIGDIQSQGIKVLLPNLNKAQHDFIPDVKSEAIFYGMQAINGLSAETIDSIIDNRPYVSLEDFISKTPLSNLQMITLIKAGAFDEVEKKSRLYIMDKYLKANAAKKTTRKTSLSMANFNKALEYGIVPNKLSNQIKMTYFKKWIEGNCVYIDVNNKKRYRLEEDDEIKFFSIIMQSSLTMGKEYDTTPKGFSLKANSFKTFYDSYLAPLKDWLNSEEGISLFYEAEVNALITEWESKYCKGSLSKWEMDSLSYYYSKHELSDVDNSKYNIKNFSLLPEMPTPTSYKTNQKTGVQYPNYDLVRIAGTVLSADKAKHIVSVLTIYGVVDVKFYKFAFIQFNKRISKITADNKKIVIEGSWFTRGNQLLISGIRKENMFIPRKDFTTGYNRAVQLIQDVKNGELILQGERAKGD